MTRVFEEFMQGDAEVLVRGNSQSPELWALLFTRASVLASVLLTSVLTCAAPSGSFPCGTVTVFPPLLCKSHGGCGFPTTVFARQVEINAWCFSESVELPLV